jgi:signal transduction histidine kinase
LYCEEFGDREGIAVEFTSQDAPPAFPREIARCLYRVPEEDLRNIAKHAQATRIAFAFVSRIPAAGFGFRRFGRHPQH